MKMEYSSLKDEECQWLNEELYSLSGIINNMVAVKLQMLVL